MTSRESDGPGPVRGHDRLVAALISLGSNIDPSRHLPEALELLAGRLELTAVSSLYESPAKGAPTSPSFLNAAVLTRTDLSARSLKFDVLRPLEARMGRVRGLDPNEPRVIDLDLTLYDDLVVDRPDLGLVLPDPELSTSAHVILPAAEIAGEWIHPVSGQTLAELAEAFRDAREIRVVDLPAGRARPGEAGPLS